MKYSIPVTLVLSCALSATARAQEAESKAANADVLATVKQDVVLTSTGQTNFGTVGNSGHTETIDPRAPTGAQTTAMFKLTNPGGGTAVITCSSSVALTEAVSSAQMSFTPALSVSLSEDQASSSPSGCGAAGSGVVQAWFWLGGNLAVALGQPTGSYRGVFTLTVLHE